MLRMVLNVKRFKREGTAEHDKIPDQDEDEVNDTLEPWPDFLKRTARWTEEQLKKAGQEEWLDTWRSRKWKWACKLMTHDTAKWSADCTLWQPYVHSKHLCRRARARPKKRWAQDIEDFLKKELPDEKQGWKSLARDETAWKTLTSRFVAGAAGL